MRERADDILQVVHTDLCGPMQTVGLSDERYFITFIDACSGRVSLSLLHTMDEALTAFQTYSRRRIEVAFLYGYNVSWRGNVGSFVSRI